MPDRVLIVANALVDDARNSLPESLRRDGPARELMVIAPLLTTRTQSIFSDVDGPRRDAESRLSDIAADMGDFRETPRVGVAEEDQVQAVADALADFDAEACVVVEQAAGREGHRERGVAERIHARFGLPTTALTVDAGGRIVGHRQI